MLKCSSCNINLEKDHYTEEGYVYDIWACPKCGFWCSRDSYKYSGLVRTNKKREDAEK